MLPWKIRQPKNPAGPGAWRVWSRAHAPTPVLPSQGSVSRDGSLPGGQQQQQDEQQRRISLSGCFLKITLPLSAGQGCSRLNNRSRPALPCSRAGMCRVDAAAQPLGERASLSPGLECCIPHPASLKMCCWGCPELTPLSRAGDNRGSCAGMEPSGVCQNG